LVDGDCSGVIALSELTSYIFSFSPKILLVVIGITALEICTVALSLVPFST